MVLCPQLLAKRRGDQHVILQEEDENHQPLVQQQRSRRKFLTTVAAASNSLLWLSPLVAAADDEQQEETEKLPVLKTSSGLKYIDLRVGTGTSPEYGNLVSIAYTAYIKLPETTAAGKKKYNTQPQAFDQQDAYLIKHGNAQMIAGLDEGLHTMKVGGRRRILIPPKLGFVDVGLGPVPELPWNRWKLNKLLDDMVAVAGGTLIYEVTLKSVLVDEADQGYYQDSSLTPEEFATLQKNLRIKANAELAEQAKQAAITSGEDKIL